MKPLAIAFLVVRTAVRSRLLLCLMGVLLLISIGLPLTIEGDGTALGEIRTLIEYTLGLSVIILGIAAVSVSCGAISREIEDRHIRLLVVKPVRSVQIWLGKWLGLLMLNSLLLCIVGMAVYAGIQWTMRAGRYSETERRSLREEQLAGRRRVLPEPEDVDGEIYSRFAELERNHALPEPALHEELMRVLGRRILAERATVAPGESKQWVFSDLQNVEAGERVRVRVNLAPSGVDRNLLSGSWRLGSVSQPDALEVTMSDVLAKKGYIEITAALTAGGQPLRVVFSNRDSEGAATVVFDVDVGVELLASASGFEANLLRTFLVIFCHLALLSALGLTAGCLFSLPVATFLSASLVFVAMMGHYVTLQSDTATAGRDVPVDGIARSRVSVFLQDAGERIVRRTEFIVEPVAHLNPLPPLSDGLLVSWAVVGKAAGLLGLIYPLVLGAIGTWSLYRRELALPSE